MNSQKNTGKKNKRGSYIVEAAMSLPVFIICIVSLALVIKIIASIEGIIFDQTCMLHRMQMDAPQIYASARGDNYRVKRFRYMYSKSGIDDLISLDTESKFRVENPIGVHGKIDIDLRIIARAYTGVRLKSGTLSEEDFHNGESVPVIVFPKYGIRYHRKDCRYSVQEYAGEEIRLEMQKNDAENKGYEACLICGGG